MQRACRKARGSPPASWWPADYQGPPLVSFDAALAAAAWGCKVGDTLTVNLLGREITAVIANLRAIDWERLGINFAMVFAPGTLEHAPQTHLAAVYLPQAEEDDLARAVTERFPNISAIHVREALAAVDRIVGMIGDAVRLTGARHPRRRRARSRRGGRGRDIIAGSTMPSCSRCWARRAARSPAPF